MPVGQRELPNDFEAEQAVLGSVLISKDALAEVVGQLTSEQFYHQAHRLIYAGMMALYDMNQPVDVTTLTAYLRDMNQLDKMGSVEYLMQLSDSVPTSAHVRYYAKIIEDKSNLRKLIFQAENIVNGAYEQIEDINQFISDSEQQILKVTRNRATGEFRDVHSVIQEVTKELMQISQNNGEVAGLATKFRDFDKITQGFQKGDLIILGARPSVGKTAFTLNIATNVAHRNAHPVAFFSLEMPAEQLIKRCISAMGGIDGSLLRNAEILKSDANKYYAATERVSECNLYIDDTPGIKINDLIAKARRLKQEHGLSLIVIDYLQLIVGNGGESRQQEVSEISRQLKALARELEVPLIALSQLSRSLEKRDDKRPMMSDLRESGAIEQDADIIIFLYREGYYDQKADKQEDTGIVEINIAKHRNGPTGKVSLALEKNYSRFSDLAKQHQEQLAPTKDLRN